MSVFYDENSSTLHMGDCLDVMAAMPANSVGTIITDPPYHLTSGKAGGTGAASLNPNSPAGRSRIGTGFMGKAWDGGDVAFRPETWAAALRVCKPGAFLLAFGGTRTFHRLACAIEDAGWEIRDCMSWLYGSGFPKSLDISKAINKAAGAERKVVGQTSHPDGRPRNLVAREIGVHEGGQRLNGVGLNITAPATPDAEKWSGWGTALKPAWEPIIVAMKPLEGTFAENAQRHGVAGLNIDGARIEAEPRPLVVSDRRNGNGVYRDGLQGSKMIGETSQGRWPANVLLDEESARQLDEQGGERVVGSGPVNRNGARQMDGWGLDGKTTGMAYGDTGGASRFFYTAKASRSDRGHGNDHPTVKPTDLIKYLCKLTAAPTGGVILDPFAGSGTTLVAAREVGRPCIGIELDEKHCRIVVDRLRQGVLFAPGRESA